MEDTNGFSLRPYRRAWWLPGSHLQTVGGWLFRPRASLALRRERLETPDGDFVDLDFAPAMNGNGDASDRHAPLVLVLHGLEGGSRSLPAQQAVRALNRHGIAGVILNFRSCSGEPNRTARLYHAGDTEDLHLVVSHLRHRYPGRDLGVLGYSLGGNVVLKYLGERGTEARAEVRCAAAVSVPFDLAAGARKLERGAGRAYAAHFLRSLRRKYRSKSPLIGARCDAGRIARSRTIREFDDAATAPLHGFRDAAHYYSASSSGAYLERVRVPTLLLHAIDDPFLPSESVPFASAGANPHVLAGFPPHGGHMGFIAGPPWAAEYWAEAEAARFLAHHLRASRD